MSLFFPLVFAMAAGGPQLTAARKSDAPVLDGKLDDAAWARAVPSNGFTQKFPHEGARLTESTTLRVLYDDVAIYAGVDCPQSTSPIVPHLTRSDGTVESDWIAVDLDTRGDGKSAWSVAACASRKPHSRENS
jgi:hypothetical protein